MEVVVEGVLVEVVVLQLDHFPLLLMKRKKKNLNSSSTKQS